MEFDLRYITTEDLVQSQIPGPGLGSPVRCRARTTQKARQRFGGDRNQVLKNRKTLMQYSDGNVKCQ